MSFCAFAQLVTTFILFSAWDKSRTKWDNSQNSTQKMRTIVSFYPECFRKGKESKKAKKGPVPWFQASSFGLILAFFLVGVLFGEPGSCGSGSGAPNETPTRKKAKSLEWMKEKISLFHIWSGFFSIGESVCFVNFLTKCLRRGKEVKIRPKLKAFFWYLLGFMFWPSFGPPPGESFI